MRDDPTDQPISVSEGGGTPALEYWLTDEQIEELVKYVRSGRRLPTHLFPFLFEIPQEYQLSYAAKARRADVLTETMALPLQPVKTFGSAGRDGWDEYAHPGRQPPGAKASSRHETGRSITQ